MDKLPIGVDREIPLGYVFQRRLGLNWSNPGLLLTYTLLPYQYLNKEAKLSLVIAFTSVDNLRASELHSVSSASCTLSLGTETRGSCALLSCVPVCAVLSLIIAGQQNTIICCECRQRKQSIKLDAPILALLKSIPGWVHDKKAREPMRL